MSQPENSQEGAFAPSLELCGGRGTGAYFAVCHRVGLVDIEDCGLGE